MSLWSLIGAVIIPHVGGRAGAISMEGQVTSKTGRAWYQTIKKPSYTPRNWAFAPIWAVLYTTMGYASFIVYKDCGGFTEKAIVPMTLYAFQVLLNWTWTPVFFAWHRIGQGLLHMVALDIAMAVCAVSFFRINQSTFFFLAPYLCWLVFSTTLNYSIWKLNWDRNTKKE